MCCLDRVLSSRGRVRSVGSGSGSGRGSGGGSGGSGGGSGGSGGSDSFCRVECDASSATYPLAFAAVTASAVTVHGVGSNSLQGDAGFAHLLGQMGCTIAMTEDTTTTTGPSMYALGDGGLKAVRCETSGVFG